MKDLPDQLKDRLEAIYTSGVIRSTKPPSSSVDAQHAQKDCNAIRKKEMQRLHQARLELKRYV